MIFIGGNQIWKASMHYRNKLPTKCSAMHIFNFPLDKQLFKIYNERGMDEIWLEPIQKQ